MCLLAITLCEHIYRPADNMLLHHDNQKIEDADRGCSTYLYFYSCANQVTINKIKAS